MATRYPLILDTDDSNKLKELPNGDKLNLDSNDIVNVVNVTATGTITAGTISAANVIQNGNTLQSVAFSGNYNDLTSRPTIFSGSWNNLTDKPAIFDGDYNSLVNKPTIATNTSQLTNDAGFITAAQELQSLSFANGTLTISNGNSINISSIDITGSVFADNSTLLVDRVAGNIPSANISGTEATNWNAAFAWGNHASAGYQVAGAPYDGDLTGSVFADNSTLLVDGVNGVIPGYISIASLKTEVAASADFAAFKVRIAAL